MKFEERVRNMIQTSGTLVFINATDEYDAPDNKYGAWLLTFGLFDTFRIVKGISDNDNTF